MFWDPELMKERIDELEDTVYELERKIYRLQNHIMSADKEIADLTAKLKVTETPKEKEEKNRDGQCSS